jgi:hypothetical protein
MKCNANVGAMLEHETQKNKVALTGIRTTLDDMVLGPCAHLGFRCFDMGIVSWVMTNVVLDD